MVAPDIGEELGADWLIMQAPADPHAHLDKALSGSTIHNERGDLDSAISAWRAAAPGLTVAGIAGRAEEAVRRYVEHGTTAIRTHVDVGGELGTRSLEALHQVRDRVGHLVDLQLCALVMFPLTGSDGSENRNWMSAALERGLDLVGGAPALDPDPAGAIDLVLEAATDAGLAVDLHIDETLDAVSPTLELLARAVLQSGFRHMVTASHCVSLSMRSIDEQRRIAALVAEAGISVVVNPQTNLFLQGRDSHTAVPRGIAPIDVLTDAGVVVAAGGDNIQDPFNLVGSGDAFETAALLVAAAHRTPEEAFAMVSTEARKVMGLDAADGGEVIAVAHDNVRSAVAELAPNRRVFHRGREVVRSARQTTWLTD